jgi:hypothetical protein
MYAGQQWAGWLKENKRYLQVYTMHIYKKEGTAVPKKGFSYGLLYATCYLHKNL